MQGTTQVYCHDGNCWDNAAMESFFGKIKAEWLYNTPKTILETKQLVYEFVWHFYEKRRSHASLVYRTPHWFYYQ
ncbi:integrase core domain-containing protein [Kallipyga gabonensis]|uniref:integrase core domain-containing protein n=1 Tax=Kallipyga gabonensis TaxID=1686287 RepID=UPI0009E77056